MPKPPDLLHLFRNYGQHAIPITETEDKGVLVDFDFVQVEETLQEMEHLRLELVCVTVIMELFTIVKQLLGC